MKGLAALTAVLSLLLVGVTHADKLYSGYQVWRTAALSRDGVEKLTHLLRDARFQGWKDPGLGREGFVMVASEHAQELKERLKEQRLQPELYIPNVQTVVDILKEQNDAVKRKEGIVGLNRNVTFDRYMTLAEIDAYLDEVVATYPNMASLEVIGQSYEGRPLRVLKLATGPAPKPGVYMEAGIHAAEWLGPPSALHAVYQLTALAADNQEMLDLVDWYILPVANPDGYEFSWTTDRVWRKTRRPNPGSTCVGTDPNRNFDIHWGEGGETDPCLWNYPGPNAFSEVESQAIADYVRTKGQAGELALYMDIHTPSQNLLYPYGYTYDLPDNALIVAAEEAVAAVATVRGTVYRVGSIANLLYLAYGNSQDYAYDIAGVPFSYTWELPPGGDTNFDPPPDQILPVAQETWEGYKVLVRHATSAK